MAEALLREPVQPEWSLPLVDIFDHFPKDLNQVLLEQCLDFVQ